MFFETDKKYNSKNKSKMFTFNCIYSFIELYIKIKYDNLLC